MDLHKPFAPRITLTLAFTSRISSHYSTFHPAFHQGFKTLYGLYMCLFIQHFQGISVLLPVVLLGITYILASYFVIHSGNLEMLLGIYFILFEMLL